MPRIAARRPRPARFVVVAVAGFIAVAGAGRALVGTELPAAPPNHPTNASWRYGERLMLTTLYGALTGGTDVEHACRAAVADPVDPPAGFDRAEAVSGCRYGEWVLDN